MNIFSNFFEDVIFLKKFGSKIIRKEKIENLNIKRNINSGINQIS